MLPVTRFSRQAQVMSQISLATLEKYQEILQKEPNSKVFAALADAYRERGLLKEAENTARKGMELHPHYIGGYVALGRLLTSQKRYDEALPILHKAVQISPENLLAYQLLGQAYIELQRPQDALKAHKMALFLNPTSERSQKAVQKLETLSATDYEEDLFQMKPLPRALESLALTTPSIPVAKAKPGSAPNEDPLRRLERQLSLIDALLVRNELKKAKHMVDDLFQEFPEHPQVRRRWELLKDDEEDEAEPLRPLLSRERAVVEKQILSLQKILKKLEDMRQLQG
jgi:tetratricopeptide (TPR) repeat protein